MAKCNQLTSLPLTAM